jgi:Carboxypeptidase regulatory-like domain
MIQQSKNRARQLSRREPHRTRSISPWMTAVFVVLASWPALGADPLSLTIALQNPSVVEPFPARIELRLRNSGTTPLWLYRPLTDPNAPIPVRNLDEQSETTRWTRGAATLALALSLQGGEPSAKEAPGSATVLATVGLPHPKLVRVEPGEEAEETAIVRLAPAAAALNGQDHQPLWGRYRLTATYAAQFSNADEVARTLSVDLWHGEVTSNTVEIDLEPAPPTNTTSVAGTVVNAEGRTLAEMLVSLSDRDEHLSGQMLTDPQGRFAFTHLPGGFYWVTARRPEATEVTAVFDHVVLTPEAPAAALRLTMFPPETYDPKQILHKPVLIRVTEAGGGPAAGVELALVWSSGTVLDEVKAETAADGTAAPELIPGRNYVTLKRRGCPKEERRLDVADGSGIDDFQLTLECRGK